MRVWRMVLAVALFASLTVVPVGLPAERVSAAGLSNVVIGYIDPNLGVNSYAPGQMGISLLSGTPAGTVRSLCIDAHIGHSTSVSYQPVAAPVNWDLATLLWLSDMNTNDFYTGVALQALAWYYTGAVRTNGRLVWGNPTQAGTPAISPWSPEPWNALPAYTGLHPIGIHIGTLQMDFAEQEVYRLANKVAALKGPWTLGPFTSIDKAARTVRSDVLAGANGPLVGVPVTFTFGDGTVVTTTTAADGTATVSIPVGLSSSSVVVSADGPAPQQTWGAAGWQRVAVTGGSTHLEVPAEPFDLYQVASSVATVSGADHLPFRGGAAVVTVMFSGLTPGSSYTAAVSGRTVSGAVTGADGEVTFTASSVNGSVDVPVTVPAGFAGQTLVWFDRLLDDGGVTLATHEDLGDVQQQLPVSQTPVAEVHLRKTVSADGSGWVNAQKDAEPSYSPTPAPASPSSGSFDDEVADPGDGLPVYAAGEVVSFAYDVWLDANSTGDVTWADAPDGVVVDDSGSSSPADDHEPEYVSGDDGDGVLELSEVWRYRWDGARSAAAGESYRNYSDVPAGSVVDREDPASPTALLTTPRRDPAGYRVPSVGTSVSAQVDGSQFVGPQGGVMVDVVDYCRVVPGIALTMSAELWAADGDKVDPGVTGSTTFTPASNCGSVEVELVVPGGLKSGAYVVFETLTIGTTGTGRPIAEHRDLNDVAQTFVKRSPVSVTTSACEAVVEVSTLAEITANCDVLVVGGDPGDVVSGSLRAVRWVAGVRDCSTATDPVEWEATIDEDGEVTVSPHLHGLTIGDWEFQHAAETIDGRTHVIECVASAPRNMDESFLVLPTKSIPGRGLPGTGSDPWSLLQVGLAALAMGAAVVALGRRQRVV